MIIAPPSLLLLAEIKHFLQASPKHITVEALEMPSNIPKLHQFTFSLKHPPRALLCTQVPAELKKVIKENIYLDDIPISTLWDKHPEHRSTLSQNSQAALLCWLTLDLRFNF